MIYEEMIATLTTAYEMSIIDSQKQRMQEGIKAIQDAQKVTEYAFSIEGIEFYFINIPDMPEILPQVYPIGMCGCIWLNLHKIEEKNIDQIKAIYEFQFYSLIGHLKNERYLKLMLEPYDEYLRQLQETNIHEEITLCADNYVVGIFGRDYVVTRLTKSLNILENLHHEDTTQFTLREIKLLKTRIDKINTSN